MTFSSLFKGLAILVGLFFLAGLPLVFDKAEEGGIELHPEKAAAAVLEYLKGLVNGDSFEFLIKKTSRSFLREGLRFSLFSLFYVASAAFISMTAGFIMGLIFSGARGTSSKLIFGVFKFLGSIPDFLLIMLLQFGVVALIMHSGIRIARITAGGEGLPLFLPLLAMSLYPTIYLMKSVAQYAKEIRGEPYILFALACGHSPKALLFRHVLPAAVLLLRTELPRVIGILIANLFLVERLLQLPGIARAMFTYGFYIISADRTVGYQYEFVMNSLIVLFLIFWMVYGLLRFIIWVGERSFYHVS